MFPVILWRKNLPVVRRIMVDILFFARSCVEIVVPCKWRRKKYIIFSSNCCADCTSYLPFYEGMVSQHWCRVQVYTQFSKKIFRGRNQPSFTGAGPSTHVVSHMSTQKCAIALSQSAVQFQVRTLPHMLFQKILVSTKMPRKYVVCKRFFPGANLKL